MTDIENAGQVPVDSFRVRLAIVRALMGWNYDQAQTATGVSSESWRLWEKGRRCTDVIGVSRKIAEATGFDATWLVLGGPLVPEGQEVSARPLRAVEGGARTRRVSSGPTRECSALTRRRRVGPPLHSRAA